MKTQIRKFFVFLSILSLQACSIAVNHIRNPLPNDAHANRGVCNIKYSLVIDSDAFTITYGKNNTEPSRLNEIKEKYILATKEALQSIGCKSEYSDNAVSSNLIINIERHHNNSALPQEWLTGLSFGLIPSWGTRPAQYTYSFTNKENEESHSYVVDQKSYNHLILFPVFWITFITADEYKTYKEAIINFIKNS